MRRSARRAFVAAAIWLAAGCRSPTATVSNPAASSSALAPPAIAASAPLGDDMCQEHGVLEAVCTKCNPKLIPVFKARGDWCEVHGYPESFCPICHPERGGRPNVKVERDDAPKDGLRVKLAKKDTAARAGIEVARAVERPGTSSISAPARLTYDATKVAQVNARSPGVVRELKVDVGSPVKKGQALVVVDSPDVGADRARLVAAKARVAVAEENYARTRQMVIEGIASRQGELASQQELDLAKAEHGALAASLTVLGIGGGGAGAYSLAAPIAGVVTERRVTIGKLVGSEEVLLEIVDTASMWADIEVPESDVRYVAPGRLVSLELDGLRDREISGTVSYVAPVVDVHTRSAKVRVPLQNPDGLLRANMYGQARLQTLGDRAVVSVPRAAIQRVKNVQLVFVRLTEDEFETRRVTTGPSTGDLVEIASGVKAGEEVATTGSFLLKTETLKDSIGAGCCEVK